MRRNDMLADIGGVHVIVVEPSDTVTSIEAAAGFPICTMPAFERVVDHGGMFEAAMTISEDGYQLVLLVLDQSDAAFLSLLRGAAIRP
jgi:hypothetical protein